MANKMAENDISKKYVKMEQREHVLKKPGMYLGSIDSDIYELWLLNIDGTKMEKKTIKYISGLFKIFDEIVANASDHYIRLKEIKDNNEINLVKDIKVNIDKITGIISVTNSGDGIDIALHPEHKIYIPELIFGNMLTSTNYNDDDDKLGVGQFGIGLKVTNIFSEWFEVQTVDAKTKQIYTQRFESNMSVINPPVIKKYTKKPYTTIKFKPDYKRFSGGSGGLTGLTDDMYEVMRKRVYDLCAIIDKDINIYFNDEKLEFRTFEKYVDLYIGNKAVHTRVCEEINERWEVIASYNEFQGFEQISFVNGLLTIRGGKHVEYILNQIIKKMTDLMQKKFKNQVIKPQAIRDNMILFIKCTVINPAFDSQSKETLTTPATKFGSKAEVSDKFIEKLYKSGMAEKIMEICAIHEEKTLKKTDGKKRDLVRGLPNLDDANWAGTAKSKECMLILTEGNSAASMALSGLSVVGRDKYGVFPLKGKVMNVKDMPVDKIANNDEITNIKKILGLESGKKYLNLNDLRYGGVMLMTDADSVTGDTPVLIKHDNQIEIKHIDDINDIWNLNENGKEYGAVNYEIWTDKGWTNIKYIMRHKVNKRIFRVLTHTGCVDVTEDHSLLNEKSEKITPNNCKVNDILLHSFPIFEENKITIPDNLYDMTFANLCKLASQLKIQYYQTYKKADLISKILTYKENQLNSITLFNDNPLNITEDEAYVMGLFWADGSCGVYTWQCRRKPKDRPREYTFTRTNYAWAIANNDISLLEKSKSIIEKIYNLEFKIIENRTSVKRGYDKAYKLIVNGGIKTKELIEKYNKLFYYKNNYTKYQNGNKYLSYVFLNSPRVIRERFLEGYYNGDGRWHDITKNEKTMDIESKISAQSIFYLCKSLGYEVSINHILSKQKIYTLNITKGYQQDNPKRIKKIWDLGITEQYVYDIETENHHFQAGIGQMIVHNTDGTHIAALIFNLFQTLWPSLIKENQFIYSMLTPIVKVKRRAETVSFYCITDFEQWREQNNNGQGWDIKYYKGLGTSTNDEAKEYFKNMKKITYKYTDKSDESIDLAFNKKRADERKEWLGGYDRNVVLDYTKTDVTYEDFIHKGLIHFSNYDLERSIPNMMDGFKISQRKIMFACLKRNLTDKEIRVAQLASYVSEHSAYHHGEASLQGAIIGMAQNFTGSNNINLLKPNGQFGTLAFNGKDAAQPRYIHTLLTNLATCIFRKQDSCILKYLDDDGLSIEPEHYIPIIPMLLVNGAIGIGTGFSTNIPSYDPLDIVDLLKRMLDGEDLNEEDDDIEPWYRGFKGEIRKIGAKYHTIGVFKRLAPTKIEVTELPIGYCTFDFKGDLETALDKIPDFKKYENYSNENNVKVTLHFTSKEAVDKFMVIEANGFTKFENDFKLVNSKLLSTTNMYAFNHRGAITKYTSAFHMIRDFYGVRLDYYAKRKAFVLGQLQYDADVMANKIRFIKDVIAEKIYIHKIKKTELEEYLSKNKYLLHEDSYDYIIRIPIYNLTTDKVAELEAQMKKALECIEKLRNMSTEDIWLEELEEFEKLYAKF